MIARQISRMTKIMNKMIIAISDMNKSMRWKKEKFTSTKEVNFLFLMSWYKVGDSHFFNKLLRLSLRKSS